MNARGRLSVAAWLAATCGMALGQSPSSAPQYPDRDRAMVTHTRERGGIEPRLSAPRAEQPSAAEAGSTCDTACLQGLVDTYLRAVVAHDPKLLPVTDRVRFTEMGQELLLGDGFWSTASGIGGSQLFVLDPEAQEAGFIGTMREFDNVVLMALRLKIQNRRVSEIETLFYRKGAGPAWSDAGLDEANARGAADAAAFAPLPVAQRASREQLAAVAAGWLAAIEHNEGHGDPKAWPVAEDCVRFVNGAQITNNPKVLIGGHGFNLAALGCRQQLQSGWFALNTRVHHRRIIAVEPERGLVFVWANIDRSGMRALQLADGRLLEEPELQRPEGVAAVFALRIENGQVRRVLELDARVPYRMGPGWEE